MESQDSFSPECSRLAERDVQLHYFVSTSAKGGSSGSSALSEVTPQMMSLQVQNPINSFTNSMSHSTSTARPHLSLNFANHNFISLKVIWIQTEQFLKLISQTFNLIAA